jgi:fermentation-respiration switch protein FrsA (DUF1100 family)
MSRLSRNIRRVIRVLVASLVGFLGVVVVAFLIGQRSLIYFPRSYEPGELEHARKILEEIRYDVPGAGPQVAFYAPPRDGAKLRPNRLWVVFGGNAARALDWEDFVAAYPDRRAAFLLVDYPGYGANAGKPTREGIVQAGMAALADARKLPALADGVPSSSPPVTPGPVPLGILGHSLGAAAALELAARAQPDRVVLASPFTSLQAVARRAVGWPLCKLLLDRFDNAARLAELSALSPRPSVAIFHGTRDEIVPFAMGQFLAAEHPGWIAFHPVPGGDHNGLLDSARQAIYAAMLATNDGNKTLAHPASH